MMMILKFYAEKIFKFIYIYIENKNLVIKIYSKIL